MLGGPAFCRAYNRAIDRLIARHGLPEWAPGRRVPDRHEALKLLESGKPFARYRPSSTDERSQVEWVCLSRRYTPLAWARCKSRRLLLIGGDLSTRTGRIDIIDLMEHFWMEGYDFRRQYYPALPWDGFRRLNGGHSMAATKGMDV
jgi:hypothetical protein